MKAVVVLMLFGAALAAAEAPKPKPCCTPDQWEGMVGSTGGFVMRHHPHKVADLVKLSYDYTNKRLAMTKFMGKVKENVIVDFKKKAVFVIFGKKCFKKQLNKPMRKMCIPANATYVGPATFGLAPNSLTIDNWRMLIKNRRDHRYFEISMGFAKGCIPVSENVVGHEKTRKGSVDASVAMGFVNISGGIKNPKIFVPPKSCSSYEEDYGKEPLNMKNQGFSEEMSNAYNRFVELF